MGPRDGSISQRIHFNRPIFSPQPQGCSYRFICPPFPEQKCRPISSPFYYGLLFLVCIVPPRNSMLDALPPLVTHQGTRLIAVLFPIRRYALVLGIWEGCLLDGMAMEWATQSITTIKCGLRHHIRRLDTSLLILCNTPIHHLYTHRLHLHHHHHQDTLILILLNTLILILFTLSRRENQITRQLPDQFMNQLPNLVNAL